MIRLSFFGNHRIRLMRLMRLKCLLRPVRSITYLEFLVRARLFFITGSDQHLGCFFLFFFWAERLRLRANHLGRGGGNIYLCICTLTLTKSHFLGKKVLSHPYGFSSNFVRLACWGFAPLTRSSAGKRSPWGGFFFLSSHFCCGHILTLSFRFFVGEVVTCQNRWRFFPSLSRWAIRLCISCLIARSPQSNPAADYL